MVLEIFSIYYILHHIMRVKKFSRVRKFFRVKKFSRLKKLFYFKLYVRLENFMGEKLLELKIF